MKFEIHEEIWKWDASRGGWHFVTIPKEESDKIRESISAADRRGFGAVKVRAKLGHSVWETSVFPTKEGTFVLPIKGEVREKEGKQEGDKAYLIIELL